MSDPIDCISPGFSRILQARILHGILQARILEWVAISFSRASSWPRDWNCVSYISCTGRRVLYHRQQLGHQVGLYETFWGAAMLFYTMAAPSYVLAGARQGFQLLHILTNTFYFPLKKKMAILTDVRYMGFYPILHLSPVSSLKRALSKAEGLSLVTP